LLTFGEDVAFNDLGSSLAAAVLVIVVFLVLIILVPVTLMLVAIAGVLAVIVSPLERARLISGRERNVDHTWLTADDGLFRARHRVLE